jgi:heptosyltransferase-2
MRKVLVIRLSSLGDVVLTGPVFETLRKAWPDAEITALTKEAFADVLSGHPAIDRLLLLRKGESVLSLIRRVRAEHFDVVIDLHSNLRSRLVALFSAARQKVRYSKAALSRRLYVRWRLKTPELKGHTLDRYYQALRRIGIETPALTQELQADPQRLLVIQTAFLGDAVLTLPFLNALKDRFPRAAVSVLCTPEVAEVFEGHPAVAETLRFDKRKKDKGWGALRRVARELRGRNYPVVFLPHRSLKSALIAWMAGVPKRIGFSSSQGRWLLTDSIPFKWGVHDADRNLALLNAVGVQKSTGELTLRPDSAACDRLAERLSAAGVQSQDRILGINAGSVWPTKRWMAEGFAAVADRVIRECGMKVIFFGGPADAPTVRNVLEAMKEKAINWVGQTQLRELIAGVSRCTVFLTNDSGPMHIAVATQVPTVAIFGPTTRELGFFPYGPGHIVIEKDLACRPCGLHGAKKCPLEHFQCMRTITPDEVFAAVIRQAGRTPSQAAATV